MSKEGKGAKQNSCIRLICAEPVIAAASRALRAHAAALKKLRTAGSTSLQRHRGRSLGLRGGGPLMSLE